MSLSAFALVMRTQSIDCFSGFPVDLVFRYCVGLLDRELCDLVGRLKDGRGDLPRLDLIAYVVRAVEADDDHVGPVGRLKRRGRAHRHRVIAGDDALDLGMSLEHRLHLGVGLGLAPVGALSGDHLQVGVLVENVVIALRANAGVGVGLLADELGVVALFAHDLDELLRAERRALVVVGDDLRDGDAGLVDLAVDQEARNAGVLGLLNRLDRSVGAGVVENDRDRFAGDRGVDQLVLLVGVVVVNEHQSVVAERLGLGGRAFGLGGEERVVVRRRDDRDQVRGVSGASAKAAPASSAPNRAYRIFIA